MILKRVFTHGRVVGVVGETHTGKTNNIIFLLDNFYQDNPKANIAIYGFKEEVADILKKRYKVEVVETLEHLSNLENTLIVLDEFQRLKIGDRRYKDLTDEFFDFIYHNNNWVILSSPNLAEFNKMICNKINTWLFKSLHMKKLVNGSEVKRIAEAYKGERKRLNRFMIEKGELLLHTPEATEILICEYISIVDMKKGNVDIFVKEKKCQEIVKHNVKK